MGRSSGKRAAFAALGPVIAVAAQACSGSGSISMPVLGVYESPGASDYPSVGPDPSSTADESSGGAAATDPDAGGAAEVTYDAGSVVVVRDAGSVGVAHDAGSTAATLRCVTPCSGTLLCAIRQNGQTVQQLSLALTPSGEDCTGTSVGTTTASQVTMTFECGGVLADSTGAPEGSWSETTKKQEVDFTLDLSSGTFTGVCAF